MEKISSTFGLRDVLSYIFPGSIVIFAFLLLNPDKIEEVKSTPILMSVFILVVSYLFGHLCKGISEVTFQPIRSKFNYNPYKNAFGKQRGDFCKIFNRSLVKMLRSNFGKGLVSLNSEKQILYPGKIVMLCWYDSLTYPTRAHDEIDRYIALFNLCKSLTSACSVFFISAIFAKSWYLVGIGGLGTTTFLAYWYIYESKFVRAILRVWFIQNKVNKK